MRCGSWRLARRSHLPRVFLPEDVRAPPVPRAQDVLQRVEKQLNDEALRRAGGVKTRAAELLGLSFRSLRYRLQKVGYSAEDDDK
ncbi:MAG TPA: helix-turn-helix domain-containing protein [Myxococcota bacterium]|nr:helix-turn-helix domain-containing protein [Myxococcota bacterium]